MANLVDASLGHWEVDGVDMIGPAWSVLNIQALWQGPQVTRSNRVQSGTQGRKGYPQVVDETVLSVQFLIVGDVDHTDTPHTDAQIGLALNYDYLRTNVWDPVDPLRTSTLTMPDGDVREAEVQFDPFPLPSLTGLTTLVGTLTVILPGGYHRPVGS